MTTKSAVLAVFAGLVIALSRSKSSGAGAFAKQAPLECTAN